MNIDDLILVSVDDHVVEPPDMFDGHMPAKYQDRAPKVDHEGRRHRCVGVRRAGGQQHRSERGAGPAARRVRHGADDVRARCGPVATTSTSAIRDMNVERRRSRR